VVNAMNSRSSPSAHGISIPPLVVMPGSFHSSASTAR
jgi:hypothetical protein